MDDLLGLRIVQLYVGVMWVKREQRGFPASYLEVEDDGPYEAEGELGVAVHNVLATDVDQLDLLIPAAGVKWL